MQWPLLILPVKNQVVEFTARWHHLYPVYKSVQSLSVPKITKNQTKCHMTTE